MSANYSVHHFQGSVGGTVTGGVTMPSNDDGGGTPTKAKYFEYEIDFMEPNNDTDHSGAFQTDPIIDIDVNSRTIRMLAKLSFIEISDNKELYNDFFIDTDNMINHTNLTTHTGDTTFKDNVFIDKQLEVLKETSLKDTLEVTKVATFKDDVVVDREITSDNFKYSGGGSVGSKHDALALRVSALE